MPFKSCQPSWQTRGPCWGSQPLAVSFFRGETTLFTNGHQLVIFISGTLSPILGSGGIALMYRSHRRADFDQRELATLFTLLLFTIAYFMRLSPYVRGLL